MVEKSDDIKQHIEDERARLGQDLNDLEYRIQSATNWRAQFERHPALMIAVAFTAGLLLSLLVTRSAMNAE